MSNAESYEVQGIPHDEQLLNAHTVLQQVAEDMVHDRPTIGVRVKFMAEVKMVVTYHCLEVDLPNRFTTVETEATKYLDMFLKELKKEFKSRTKKAVTLKEDKKDRTHSVEKVSLNARYYFRSSRTYTVS